MTIYYIDKSIFVRFRTAKIKVMEEKEYFRDGSVCTIESTNKNEAIHELITKLPVFNTMVFKKDFECEVLKREERQSTGLGRGIAVAHGHVQSGEILVGLGCSCTGINYNSIDNKPVSLLFLIANPPGKRHEYLRILSALVKLLRDNRFREKILACARSSEKEKIIRKAFQSQLLKEKSCRVKSA